MRHWDNRSCIPHVKHPDRMGSQSIFANMTTYFQSDSQAAILVESSSFFMVFSMTITLLTHKDITTVIMDFDYFRMIPQPLQDISKICVEKNVSSYHNKTFFCPYSTPGKSHLLHVLGLPEGTSYTVS